MSRKKTFTGRRSPAYLNALRAFEASARHGGFSEAAGELNVTAAAVSPLIMIGGPMLLGAVAASADSEELAALTVLYMIGAPAIDGALGREPAPKKEAISILPSLRRDALGFSLAGAF